MYRVVLFKGHKKYSGDKNLLYKQYLANFYPWPRWQCAVFQDSSRFITKLVII